MLYNNILETIGSTPIVRLNNTGPDHVELFVKVESFNPMASVKDRLAFAIMQDAKSTGKLQPGQTVVEAPSEIPHALHPNEQLVAQYRRGFLSQSRSEAPEA